MGKLNWTVLVSLADGCTARLFTVSMTLRHLATVVEIADCSSLEGLDVCGVDGGIGDNVAVVTGGKGLLELVGVGAEGCPINGKTE